MKHFKALLHMVSTIATFALLSIACAASPPNVLLCSAAGAAERPNVLLIFTDDHDPQEQHNLAATNKKVFNELATALRAHIQRGGATPWQRTNNVKRMEANE